MQRKRVGKSNTKRKSKKKKQIEENQETEENSCSVCSGKYDDSPNWILCDDCDKWVHGECAGITSPQDWEKYEDESEKFYCPFCL